MKKLLLVFNLIFFSIPLFSQLQLNNSGFENYTNLGASNEEPTDWNSFMTASGSQAWAAAQQIRRSTSTRPGSTGTYSAVIWSRSVFGIVANGNFTTGQVNMGSTTPANSANHNITRTANAAFSEVVNSFPDSIVFWVKFKPNGGTPNARMRAVVHDAYDYRDPSASDANAPLHVVGDATLNFPSTSNTWVRKSVPFTNTGPATTSAFILVTFTTNQTPGSGSANDSLWVDDVSLVYNPTITTGIINPLIYYVSATQGANLSVPYTTTGTFGGGNIFTAQLSNSAGSFAAPVSLGTLASTTSGTISGTIPAGTASGTGYRIRTTSNSPTLTGSTNVSDIQIILASNSIAPSSTQTIEAGVNGTSISATETAGFVSREWKYSLIPGGPYSSFGVAETGTSYVPNFASTGAYYVVCETVYPGGLVVRSNEVNINVVDNAVTPSGSQSLLVGVNGALLTVAETPAGTAREWKFATTPGGPYSSFGPTQTGLTYTPNFGASGTYYVVCISTISGVTCTSNEVIISVGSVTLSTGTITGSPFEFSPNAPDANVVVPFTVSGSLNPGNTFTAQLSDASGSFGSPVNIGTLVSTTSGSINATISHLTPAGNGYRIRVVSSNPGILGSDNGSDLIVDQFNNSVSPSSTQNINYGVNGTPISVTESQSSNRNWKYSINAGGPYTPFIPAETGLSYTPNFAIPGTYYVVAVSENTYNDTVTSNEVQINVANGTNLSTSAVPSSIFYLSANSAVTENISFTSDILFNGGNVFTAELSDVSGSFASPTVIGSLVSSTISPIAVNIPSSLSNGTGYRIRVTSSSPAAIGTNNGSDLQVVQFENSTTPLDTQYVGVGLNGNMLTVTANHPSGVTHEWKYQSGFNFLSFSPAETGSTYIPNFPSTGTYPVACFSTNMWNDTVQSGTVMIYVVPGSGIENSNAENITLIWNYDVLSINLQNSTMQNPQMEILNMEGKVINNKMLSPGSMNMIQLNLASGLYVCRISDQGQVFNQKFVKP